MLARIRCAIRQHHHPVRHPLGGFRCSQCGAVGADLEDMGFVGAGWVGPFRRTYSRERGEITRMSSWDSGRYPVVPS